MAFTDSERIILPSEQIYSISRYCDTMGFKKMYQYIWIIIIIVEVPKQFPEAEILILPGIVITQ